jgi:membrane fusion protein (multidrug efflux system)
LHTSTLRTVALLAALVIAAASAACGKKDDAAAAPPNKPADQNKPADSAKASGAPSADKTPAAAAAPAKPMGLPVKAEAVKIATVQTDVSAVGTLIAADSVVIRPEIAGRVVGLPFQEGQLVQKGTKLVSLDPSEYRA